MSRFRQLLSGVSLVVLSWWAMMAVHELGHVLGAVLSGGSVTRVVCHPLGISRTDVWPNPHPGVVVWCGPLVGVTLPTLLALSIPRRWARTRRVALFFAGFCLLANGAYIACGSFEGIGDCREMLATGTPRGVMVAFGIVTFSLGLLLWHRLGSVREFPIFKI
ncbi:MAG: hypothetical protein ACYC6N_22165 [Pirellulaceae bacterium]